MIAYIKNKKVLFITTKRLDYIRNTQEIRLLKQYAAKGCDANMVEVMCCEGGCVAGPGCIALAKKSTIMVENYVKTAPDLKDRK